MGCGVSRIDANGLAIPVRLRPLFLNRLDEISKSRHGRPLKDSTPSKKELLSHENDDDEHAMKTAPSSPRDEGRHGVEVPDTNVDKRDDVEYNLASREGIPRGNFENTKKEDMENREKDRLDNMSRDIQNDDDDDEDDDERMIGHEMDDDAFPGSPSFRVYFHDNEEDDHNENDAGNNDVLKDVASSDDTPSAKESSVKQKVKRGKKRRSFRLPKGGQAAVKNLLNVRSCYISSHSTAHDRTLLLTAAKTTT